MFEFCTYPIVPEIEERCQNSATFVVERLVGSHHDVLRKHLRCREHVGPTVSAIQSDYETGWLKSVRPNDAS